MSLMYCPNCESQTVITVTGGGAQPKKEKRLYYKRVRTCQSCKQEIVTVEVVEKMVEECLELKKAILEIYDISYKSSFRTKLQEMKHNRTKKLSGT